MGNVQTARRPRLGRVPATVSAVAALLLLLAAPAQAQLEEITVTANKRTERVQEVPVAISVVTPEAMERANVRSFDDLVKLAPSLTITKTTQPANNSINIRGIGTYSFSIATESSVAVVIDEVPQAFQSAAFTDLVDVQRIEVLRGPQSTLFGKSASAGVISITTRQPTDTFTARAETMFTDDNEQRLSATVSGPLADKLKFRLTGSYSHQEGQLENLSDGSHLNGNRDQTIRGKLVWTPADNWDVTFSPYYNHTWNTCCAAAPLNITPGLTFAGLRTLTPATVFRGVNIGPSNTQTRIDVNPAGNSTDWGGYLRVNYAFDGFSLTSLTSYDRYRLRDLQDVENTDINFGDPAIYAGTTLAPDPRWKTGGIAVGGWFDVKAYTQELRLTSPGTGPVKYVAGLFYSKIDGGRYFYRGPNWIPEHDPNLANYSTLVRATPISTFPGTTNNPLGNYLSTSGSTSYAAFGNATWEILPGLNLIGGLRVNREDIDYAFYDYTCTIAACLTAAGATPVGRPNSPANNIRAVYTGSNGETAVTYKAGIQYQWTPDIMTFATYSRAYKGQTYDLTSSFTVGIAATQPVKAEWGDNYEVGIKTALFNKRLIFNLTGFYEVFTDFQAQTRDVPNSINILANVGKVTSKGVELESTFQPMRDFTLSVAGAYTDAKVNSFPNATCYALQTVAEGCINNRQDLAGKPLNNVPKWNFNVVGQYDIPLNGLAFDAFVAAAYKWQSKVIYSLQQDPDSIQDAYGIVNLSGGIEDKNGRYRLTLFANNLFDKNYFLTRGRDTAYWRAVAGASTAVTGKPARDFSRYVGVRASVNY
ncbi:MAG: TonB-dependent receptor [Rhodospirillales bacterium]|nr:TonB-dependent receptor [Rhodospirillales bacterium]